MSTIAERVAAGAAFMDEHDPGWWRTDVEQPIKLDVLDLEDPAICVLGQRCPLEVLNSYRDDEERSYLWPEDRYWAYAHELSGIRPGAEVFDWAVSLGFAIAALDDAYTDLTAEWKRVIEARRTAGAQ